MCRYLDPNGQFQGVMEVPDPYYGGAKGFELVRVQIIPHSESSVALMPACKADSTDLLNGLEHKRSALSMLMAGYGAHITKGRMRAALLETFAVCAGSGPAGGGV